MDLTSPKCLKIFILHPLLSLLLTWIIGFFAQIGYLSDRYVQIKLKRFRNRFNKVKKQFQETLEKEHISIDEVIIVLKSLPADNKSKYKVFTENHLSVFERAHNQSALIGQLDFYMDYLSYHLLDYLITEFDLEQVKVQMEQYKSDLQHFREKVPLLQFCDVQKRKLIKGLPDFKEVVAELRWSTDSTLEVLEQFRQKYSSHYNLRCFSMALAQITPGHSCFMCSWLIPESVVNELKNLKRAMLEQDLVSKLSIAGSCVYCYRKVQYD